MKTLQLSDDKTVPLSDRFRGDQVSRLCGHWDNKRLTRINTSPDVFTVHQGFLDYLSLAYRNHYSVVIRPDDIWYMVLAELTLVIKKTPQHFAHLFTTTPDKKQLILVPTGDVTQIDPALVISHLKDCVPADVDLFLPQFTTTTPDSRLAMHVAFCDMASPYYDYATYLCGIPAIRVEGTEEDWAKVAQGFNKLSALFKPLGTEGKSSLWIYLDRCYKCVKAMIGAVVMDDVRNLSRIVKVERCGSGSQYEMSGWIMDFCVSNRKVQLEGLPSHIASMTYKNLDTGRIFKLFTGLTESVLQDGFLIPRYGKYVVEQFEEGSKNAQRTETPIDQHQP